MRILQCNINHSRAAQDLLLHQGGELEAGVYLVSEPYAIPRQDPRWMSSADGGAAVFCPDASLASKGRRLLSRGEGFVLAEIASLSIASCYISPARSRRAFNRVLADLGDAISQCRDRVIIGGDFNAKSHLWGSSLVNARGRDVENWLAGLDLRIVNRGSVPTCVSPQGTSIVDITMASPDLLGGISGWHVVEDVETLSDHNYIVYDVGNLASPRARPAGSYPRWAWKKLDADGFCAALEWYGAEPDFSEDTGIDVIVDRVSRWLREACDAGAPRASGKVLDRPTYWWCEEVAEARRSSIVAQRAWKRCKR